MSIKQKSGYEDFNRDWLFALEDDAVMSNTGYNDKNWRTLNLPHDWSIEFAPDKEKGDGATAYLLGGIGWYRKHFTVTPQDDQLTFVLFDGVYNNSEVWLNEQRLGENPYGYSPFWFELTPHLAEAGEQVLSVRVDHHSYVDSRWYTGSGIYRDVKLVSKSRLHIPIWGTKLSTPEVSADKARVEVVVTVNNAFANKREGMLRTLFLDTEGHEVASASTEFSLDAGAEVDYIQSVEITSPDLWDVDAPNMYRAVSTLLSDGVVCDSHETPFGIRSFRFDVNEGFFLNERNRLIKGVCLHHAAGLVGAAVPDGVWRRRLEILKDMGCNAIRTAHNPCSAAFLDLCDEMGFLVQLEFFDEMDNPKDKRLNMHERHDDELSRGYDRHFREWAESDLKRTMLRDRNHPSIIQWSIGNEIEWAYPRYAKATGYFDAEATGNYFWTLPPYSGAEIKARLDALPAPEHTLTDTAHKLATWTREMDTTRPVTANCILPSVSHVSGYADALDVVGYSYRQVMYDACHADYPDKVIMGTENLGQWHEWKHVLDRPFISGLFIWTGISYLGEAHRKGWPSKASGSGLMDLGGFKRGSGEFYKTLWRDDPQIHIVTQTDELALYHRDAEGKVVEKEPGAWKRRLWGWHAINNHWNYDAGTDTIVEVYTNCAAAELFLNGRSLGVQQLAESDDRILRWAAPFEAGILEVRAVVDGETMTASLTSANEPASIQLSVDKAVLTADGYDVAHIIAQLVDVDGVLVKHVEQEIVFNADDGCRVLGVDNGAVDNVQPYQADRVMSSQGRALMIVQAGQEPGSITVTATAGDLKSNEIKLTMTGA